MSLNSKRWKKTVDVKCCITKTRLYSFDPLKPHFYTVKLGFTGVYINFLIYAQMHRLSVLVRTASAEAVLKITHNLCFEQKYENFQNYSSESFHFFCGKFSIYLNRRVFVMASADYLPPSPHRFIHIGQQSNKENNWSAIHRPSGWNVYQHDSVLVWDI